jgi:hypothetical protein
MYGRRKRDVPECRRTKLSDVLGSLCVFKETAVRRQIRRYASVEKAAGRIAFAFSILDSFESDCAEIPAAVALKASPRSLDENRSSPRLADSEIADESPPQQYTS